MGRRLTDDFYQRVKPRLYRRVGEELQLADRILDLGCGNCELAEFLSETYDHRVTGVDISSGAFPGRGDEAQKRSTLTCVKADAARLGFVRDGSVDAVVSIWAAHEMEDLEGVLREARRVLRPGGEILVVDFPQGSLAQRLWDESYYSPEEVSDALKGAGQGNRAEADHLGKGIPSGEGGVKEVKRISRSEGETLRV